MMFLSIVLILFTYCSDNGVNPPEIPSDIPSDESPAWSPDGKWIAYWHYNPNLEDSTYQTGLYIIDTTGKEHKLIIEGKAWNPDWNPKDNTLVFDSNNLFIISSNGNNLFRITGIGGCHFPRYSPDGDLISFGKSGTQDSVGIWFYNKNGNETKRWGFGAAPADWSPTGDYFVYEGPANSVSNGNQIWKADTSGSIKIQLTENNFITNRYPAWSPDGLKIAWSVTAPDIYYSDIWIMNADGTEQRRLTTGAYPSWSPDSKKLVFMKPLPDKSKGVLWIIDLQSMQIKQLTH